MPAFMAAAGTASHPQKSGRIDNRLNFIIREKLYTSPDAMTIFFCGVQDMGYQGVRP
jgi:hypothetical protein